MILLSVAILAGPDVASAAPETAAAAGCTSSSSGSTTTADTPTSSTTGDTSTSSTTGDTSTTTTGGGVLSSATSSPSPVAQAKVAAPQSSAKSGLAFTGAAAISTVILAGLLLGAGLLLVVSARRRRRPGPDSLGCAVVGLIVAHLIIPAGAVATADSSPCTPAAQMPESPLGILLPIAGLGVLGLAYLYARRRPSATDR